MLLETIAKVSHWYVAKQAKSSTLVRCIHERLNLLLLYLVIKNERSMI